MHAPCSSVQAVLAAQRHTDPSLLIAKQWTVAVLRKNAVPSAATVRSTGACAAAALGAAALLCYGSDAALVVFLSWSSALAQLLPPAASRLLQCTEGEPAAPKADTLLAITSAVCFVVLLVVARTVRRANQIFRK